ncbi:UDP-2,3-diacylglucosamine diphosphatase [Flavobacterium sp.]|uniref:UDP-2,3-diacylglucosamine diphosphatase n=1 Tax=Flavobacterium sp. TaxID=239 RepID=UPI0025BD1DF5|nr:UDP-2,3-diacylglucosamine diphosphatase [Flavobacterium sp.]
MARKVDIVVISDVHLGTYGCQAKELLHYLKSVQPKQLIINGDFIDIWQFKKSYFPKSHLKIIKKIIDFSNKGTEVTYIIGNHDEFLRRFSNASFGNIALVNKKILELGNKKAWFFHGDVFDASVQHSKWIAKLGGWGYDLLIRLNVLSNWILVQLGKEKYSFSKKIKNNVKKAVRFIGDFEKTASELAIENNFDYVICGHIHQPQIREIETKNGRCTYLNSGDWIENLTALEYHNSEWTLFTYDKKMFEENKDFELDPYEQQTIEMLIKDVINF